MEVFNTRRSLLLQEAHASTNKDRNSTYGNPEDNFQNIANFWNNYLAIDRNRRDINSADVAVMCMLIKIARLGNNINHHDSAVDVAGYAACLADCQSGHYGETPTAN